MPPVSVERPRGTADVATSGASVGSPDDEAPPSRPSKDVIFEVLRTSRRREVLRYLDAHGGEATVGDLAVRLAAVENDVDRSAVTSSQRKRTYVGLYQGHLPKLDGYGVVDWDKDRGLVRLLERSQWFLAYLYFDPDDGRSTPDAGGNGTLRGLLGRLVGR